MRSILFCNVYAYMYTYIFHTFIHLLKPPLIAVQFLTPQPLVLERQFYQMSEKGSTLGDEPKNIGLYCQYANPFSYT